MSPVNIATKLLFRKPCGRKFLDPVEVENRPAECRKRAGINWGGKILKILEIFLPIVCTMFVTTRTMSNVTSLEPEGMPGLFLYDAFGIIRFCFKETEQ